MIVRVCMGSSCYLKGSYKVVEKLKEIRDKVPGMKIYGSLCLGNCSKGICIEIDGEIVSGVNEENVKEIFLKKITTGK
ncbi:MAG: hypothetical protein PWQ20_1726 [Thermotogaceae bacterium]|jgi:NADH:ubiquinone oxidoreductase subunit E|nr:hypothetical protein [Thermotogaceae bacterium]MDN5338656.1 hypothetical protein [Thermotogaceae bacterium]